ncbi:MAG: dihydropteroate synthase [Bacillota bacterium]|nr:dihydropteroate synthase [Bacillota bacterium]REJ34959.1 MAG: dihydropteroate synthase [Bacillota bacterium]
MGIINVTPDSFSDGGLCLDPDRAAQRARELVAQGADLLDLGAESTRPGSEPVDAATELARLLPALRAVRRAVDVPISVDTYKARVAEAALREGADLINDISGLSADPDMAPLAAAAGVPVILMHRRPFDDPYPGDVWEDVLDGLGRSIARAEAAGVPRRNLIVDPGFGFGKTDRQNFQLVRELSRLKVFGLPTLLGPSRKSTLGRLLDLPVDQREEATGAVTALAVAQGVDFVRVHDVRAAVRVVRTADAVMRGVGEPGAP